MPSERLHLTLHYLGELGEVETASLRARLPGLPVNLDGIRRQPARLPALGEHTEQVLAELGG